MTQALTKYHAMYEAVRSRRRRPEVPKGLGCAGEQGGGAGAEPWGRGRRGRRRGQGDRQAVAVDPWGWRRRCLTSRSGGAGPVRAWAGGRRAGAAVAVLCEVARRVTGRGALRRAAHGGACADHGRIVEMLTGEGKTLTVYCGAADCVGAQAPACAHGERLPRAAPCGEPVPIYNRCLLAVGAIQQEMGPRRRFEVYARQIVYGTPKQITADYLRQPQTPDGADAQTAWAGRQQLAQSAGGGPPVPGCRRAWWTRPARGADRRGRRAADHRAEPAGRRDVGGLPHGGGAGGQAGRGAGLQDRACEAPGGAEASGRGAGSRGCSAIWRPGGEPLWCATRRAEELGAPGAGRQALLTSTGSSTTPSTGAS